MIKGFVFEITKGQITSMAKEMKINGIVDLEGRVEFYQHFYIHNSGC